MSENEKGAGRPSVKDSDILAMDDILRSKEKVDALIKSLKQHALETEQHKRRGKNLSDDITAIAKDTFGLSKKKYTELMTALDGDVDNVISLLTSTVDTLQYLKEKSIPNSVNESEGDENE